MSQGNPYGKPSASIREQQIKNYEAANVVSARQRDAIIEKRNAQMCEEQLRKGRIRRAIEARRELRELEARDKMEYAL